MNQIVYIPKSEARNCFYCRREFNPKHKGNASLAKTRDHVYPRSLGGNGHGNIVWCCATCNRMKGDLTLEAFLEKVRNHIEERKTFKSLHPDNMPVVIEAISRLIITSK